MYEVNPGEIGFDSSLRGFELSGIDCTCVRTRKLRDHRNHPNTIRMRFRFDPILRAGFVWVLVRVKLIWFQRTLV